MKFCFLALDSGPCDSVLAPELEWQKYKVLLGTIHILFTNWPAGCRGSCTVFLDTNRNHIIFISDISYNICDSLLQDYNSYWIHQFRLNFVTESNKHICNTKFLNILSAIFQFSVSFVIQCILYDIFKNIILRRGPYASPNCQMSHGTKKRLRTSDLNGKRWGL